MTAERLLDMAATAEAEAGALRRGNMHAAARNMDATAALLRRLSDPSDEMLDAASKAFEVALMNAPDQRDDESDEAWGVEIGRLGVRAALSELLTGEGE